MDPLLTVALAHLAVLLPPGPDFALVTRCALRGGAAAGVGASAGIALGIIIQLCLSLFGLGLLLSQQPVLARALQWGGAGYLAWMGLRDLRHSFRPPGAGGARPADPAPRRSPAAAARAGLICNLLNPKALLFCLSLFAAAFPVSAEAWQRLAGAALVVMQNFVWFAFVAVVAGQGSRALPEAAERWLERLLALVLLTVALWLVLRD